MLSLLLVASFVLPSVFGGCCLPSTMRATLYTSGSKDANRVLIDFNQNKFLVETEDETGKQSTYSLTDINTEKTYIKNDKGACVVKKIDVPSSVYDQCLPSKYKAGMSNLGPVSGGLSVDLYIVPHAPVVTTMAVTSDCVPVVSFNQLVGDASVSTYFWTNVTTGITDLSPLDIDLSNCEEEPAPVG